MMEGNMKYFVTLVTAGALAMLSFRTGTVYKTSTGTIKFFSKTKMENIDATNSQVAAAVASTNGAVEFSVTINSFQFKKAQMQKHFQENYMESGKYPTSTFKGTITNNSAVSYTKDGTYAVSVKGKLTMHGVTKEITTPGKVIISGKKATLTCDFSVKPKDYNIKIPANNAANIAENISINVNCACVAP
jgi:polyisoprenoid-binding protein YceI